MKNVRTMRKMVNEMNKGEAIYINAINCSIGMIEQLREYIKNGVLAPDGKELKEMIVESAIKRFETGESIAPQMTYIRL